MGRGALPSSRSAAAQIINTERESRSEQGEGVAREAPPEHAPPKRVTFLKKGMRQKNKNAGGEGDKRKEICAGVRTRVSLGTVLFFFIVFFFFSFPLCLCRHRKERQNEARKQGPNRAARSRAESRSAEEKAGGNKEFKEKNKKRAEA